MRFSTGLPLNASAHSKDPQDEEACSRLRHKRGPRQCLPMTHGDRVESLLVADCFLLMNHRVFLKVLLCVLTGAVPPAFH